MRQAFTLEDPVLLIAFLQQRIAEKLDRDPETVKVTVDVLPNPDSAIIEYYMDIKLDGKEPAGEEEAVITAFMDGVTIGYDGKTIPLEKIETH